MKIPSPRDRRNTNRQTPTSAAQPQSSRDLSYAARQLARRHGLAPSIAKLIADLAGFPEDGE